MSQIDQVLSHQPQLTKGMEYLGQGFCGDVLVEFWGKAHFVGSRLEDVDLEDLVLAGTKVSLLTMISKKQWDSLEIDALHAYEDSLGVAA
jgi:hypothetical protein